MCHKIRGPHGAKSLERKGLSQKTSCADPLLWHMNSDFHGIRTPTFMPDEPFLLGVGVVLNIFLKNHADLGFPKRAFRNTRSLTISHVLSVADETELEQLPTASARLPHCRPSPKTSCRCCLPSLCKLVQSARQLLHN